MKTTIDIPDSIYRKVKAKSAIEGRAVREVAITLFSAWVTGSDALPVHPEEQPTETAKQSAPSWFASLRKYSDNARGKYDMAAIRRSIARGRTNEDPVE